MNDTSNNEKPRQRGRVRTFTAARGLGFLQPDDGGTEISFHISNVTNNVEPAAGDAVSFEIGARYDGRAKAIAIEIDLKDGQR